MNEAKKGTYLQAQKFRSCKQYPTLQPVYKAGPPDSNRNSELVQVGERDLKEMIQSSYVNSLDYILDRFLETGELPQIDPRQEERDFLSDSLQEMSDYVEMMEECREMYDLPDTMSYSDIRAELEKRLETVKGEIQNAQKTQNPQNPQKNSQPQTVEPSQEPQAVPDNGSAD